MEAIQRHLDRGHRSHHSAGPSNSVTLDSTEYDNKGQLYYAWTWNDTTDGIWVLGEGPTSAVVFTGVKSNIIFTRMNPDCGTTPGWGYVWNKTGNLQTQLGGTFKISRWYDGSWQ